MKGMQQNKNSLFYNFLTLFPYPSIVHFLSSKVAPTLASARVLKAGKH